MRKPGSRATIIAILVVGILVFGGVIFIWNAIQDILQPVGNSSKNVAITVLPGETTAQIADDLQSKGVIRNALAFRIWSRIKGLDTQLEAGRYDKINPNMNISQIVDILQRGQPDEFLVRVNEGTRLQEIANAIAAQPNLTDFNKAQFLKYASDFKTFPDAKKYPLFYSSVPDGASMEGLLFPDTYYVSPTATARDMINKMLTETNTQIQTNNLVQKAQKNQMSLYDFVTLASIVEREAGNTTDMPKIASVYWNRIYTDNGVSQTNGGYLQADPTVQYARDSENPPTRYWTPLNNSGDNIATDSKWNTYINIGLPPTPICSPGLTSLEAAASPAQTNDIYFFADKNGITHFQPTLNQFTQEKTQYGVSN